MKGVGTVIGGQRTGGSVQGEFRACNPIPIAADQGAEIGMFAEIARQVVKSQHDIAQGSLAVGHLQGHHDAAVVDDAGLDARRVGEGEDMNLTPIVQVPEPRLGNRIPAHPAPPRTL